jgi:uncharacterized protein YecT (DUF1311 family)
LVLALAAGVCPSFAVADDSSIPDMPRPQDITIVETCLNGIDARGGDSAEVCLGEVEHACEDQFGSNTIELSECRELEAATWAVLLDHELANALNKARFVDARCATDWKAVCMVPNGLSLAEQTLRQSQADWVAMLSTSCDYKYRLASGTSAKNPDFTDCLRKLVFQRQQFFWQPASAGCECNIDQQLRDMHYDGMVVPFRYRTDQP